jgi:hypothetical protein
LVVVERKPCLLASVDKIREGTKQRILFNFPFAPFSFLVFVSFQIDIGAKRNQNSKSSTIVLVSSHPPVLNLHIISKVKLIILQIAIYCAYAFAYNFS